MSEDNLFAHSDEAGRVPGALYIGNATNAMPDWTAMWDERDDVFPQYVEFKGRRYVPKYEQEPEYSYYEPPPQETLDKIVEDSRKVERNRLVWEAMQSYMVRGFEHSALKKAVDSVDVYLKWRDKQ